MLLYISSNENIGIFDFLADEQGMIIKKFNGTFQLKQFVMYDMRSLTHYGFLAIDLAALRDDDGEIMEAIMAFKSMYTSRVIFYVDKVEENEQLIGQLMEQGIYNIVVSDEVEPLKEKIRKATGSLGMSKRDALGLLNQEENASPQFRPDYRFTQKELKVALTGIKNRVGTTTMAFNLCHFLSGLGAKVCYVEANGSGHLSMIVDSTANMVSKGNTTIHNGICFMDLYGESDETFDFIIYDMGVVESKVVGAIKNKCDLGVLCTTAKPYDMDEYVKENQLFDGIDVSRVYSFVHEMEQRRVVEEFGEGYFSEYTPSLFDSESNSDMWMQILNKFIVRNTSGFEYESLVDNLKIGQRKPIDKLSALEIDIVKLADEYQEDGLFIVNKLKEFHDLLYDKSNLKDELLSRLKYNQKHKKIAVVVPYAYYSNIIYELGIGQKVYGELSVYTANRFDNARCFDEIYVVGFTEGKRFNAYRNYNGRRVVILGYEYEKKFVQYHAWKSEEYCKKLVANSTKTEYEQKNIVIPEVKIDDDLSNFVRTKLTSINMVDYINSSNYNGSSTSEAIIAAIFDDGEKAFFTKGYKPYVLDAGNRNIIRKNVDKVNRGDILVFTKNGTITQDIVDEMLIDLVENSLMDEKDIEAYKYWKRWKALLRTHIDESDNDYRQVSKNFKNVGVNKQPQTIRTWIEPQYHITGPKEKNVYRKLGEVVDDEDLLINGEKYWKSTNKIRSIRTNILKLIGQSVMNEICGISFNDPIYKRISSNTQRIADLLEISSIEKIQPTKLPNGLVNRPLE